MGFLSKALAGAGGAMYSVGLEEFKNQASLRREERLMELKSKVPQAPEEYTLGPGQRRYRGDQLIAEGPKDEKDIVSYGEFEQVPGAPQGTFGQKNLKTGKYDNVQSPKKGIRYTAPDGSIIEIGGSDSKMDAARKDKELLQAEIITNKVDEALDKVGFFSTGFIGQVLRGVGGTPAYNLDKTVETVQANLGFQELNKMRELSETGGALGQVTVREIELLQNTIASLDTAQDKDQLAENLKQVRDQYMRVRELLNAQKNSNLGEISSAGQNQISNTDVNVGRFKIEVME